MATNIAGFIGSNGGNVIFKDCEVKGSVTISGEATNIGAFIGSNTGELVEFINSKSDIKINISSNLNEDISEYQSMLEETHIDVVENFKAELTTMLEEFKELKSKDEEKESKLFKYFDIVSIMSKSQKLIECGVKIKDGIMQLIYLRVFNLK